MIWVLEGGRMVWVGREERKNIVGGKNRMSGGLKVEESWYEIKVIVFGENL